MYYSQPVCPICKSLDEIIVTVLDLIITKCCQCGYHKAEATITTTNIEPKNHT
jgi:Zn ribbon nucleic-acid-binding protein